MHRPDQSTRWDTQEVTQFTVQTKGPVREPTLFRFHAVAADCDNVYMPRLTLRCQTPFRSTRGALAERWRVD